MPCGFYACSQCPSDIFPRNHPWFVASILLMHVLTVRSSKNMQLSNLAHIKYVRSLKLAGAFTAIAMLAACSSLPPPVEQMAVTRTTVERVSSAPSAVDAAPVELSQAREKLARAERAMHEHLMAQRVALKKLRRSRARSSASTAAASTAAASATAASTTAKPPPPKERRHAR